MKDIADLLARFFIALLFSFEAYDKIVYFDRAKEVMIDFGWTWKPELFLVISIILLAFGSFLVLIGYYANLGAFLLLLYWLPVTIFVSAYWETPSMFNRAMMLELMRNLAVCSGLLLLIANSSGKFSIKRTIYILRLPND